MGLKKCRECGHIVSEWAAFCPNCGISVLDDSVTPPWEDACKTHLVYRYGDVYDGGVINGQRHRKGRYTWKAGQYFVGGFCQNAIHGQGKFYLNDNQFLEGRWVNNVFKKEFPADEYDGGKEHFFFDAGRCAEYLGTSKRVRVPEGVTQIGSTAPLDKSPNAPSVFNQHVESVVLPKSTRRIGWNAFRNCANLRQVIVLRDGIQRIETGAFINCPKLEPFLLEVENIMQGAFDSIPLAVTIPQLETELRNQAAFQQEIKKDQIVCDQEHSYVGYVIQEELGDNRFEVCTLFTSTEVDRDDIDMPVDLYRTKNYLFVKELDGFRVIKYIGDQSAERVIIPNQVQELPVTSIAEEAFFGFDGHAEMVIPETVASIQNPIFCSGFSQKEAEWGIPHGFFDIYGRAGSGAEEFASDNHDTFRDILEDSRPLPQKEADYYRKQFAPTFIQCEEIVSVEKAICGRVYHW